MLLIRCPWCGERAQIEFRHVGDASRGRPGDLDEGPAEVWFEHVYRRDNPRGPHLEHWQHTGGCRRYLTVLRDTLTHEILVTGVPGGLSSPDDESPVGTRAGIDVDG